MSLIYEWLYLPPNTTLFVQNIAHIWQYFSQIWLYVSTRAVFAQAMALFPQKYNCICHRIRLNCNCIREAAAKKSSSTLGFLPNEGGRGGVKLESKVLEEHVFNLGMDIFKES